MGVDPKDNLGPQAAFNRALLPTGLHELFDYATDQIRGSHQEACMFASLVQACACANPMASYWECVRTVKEITGRPTWPKLRDACIAQAKDTLTKKAD